MHSNETPEENHESSEVSASEVPINHMMDINDSDSDFEDISSDEENNRDYQLLTAQEVTENGGQQTVYYPHNYNVEWIDWDQYEEALEDTAVSNDDSAANSSTNRSDANTNSHSVESTNQTNESTNRRQTIALTNDSIDVIKTLMTGFTLPEDNIPVWAQELPEDQWKELLSRKLDANKALEDK